VTREAGSGNDLMMRAAALLALLVVSCSDGSAPAPTCGDRPNCVVATGAADVWEFEATEQLTIVGFDPSEDRIRLDVRTFNALALDASCDVYGVVRPCTKTDGADLLLWPWQGGELRLVGLGGQKLDPSILINY